MKQRIRVTTLRLENQGTDWLRGFVHSWSHTRLVKKTEIPLSHCAKSFLR